MIMFCMDKCQVVGVIHEVRTVSKGHNYWEYPHNRFPLWPGSLYPNFFPHIFVWGSCFCFCILFAPPPTPVLLRLLRHLLHTTLSHTTLSHTTLSHTIFLNVTHNFVTPLSHTALSHTTLSHTIFHTQICHIQLSHTTLSHTCVAGVSTFVLRGRRGTFDTGLDLVARLGAVSRPWRRGTLRGRRGTCSQLRSAWQAWHLWHWAGYGGALGRRRGTLCGRCGTW